MTLLSSRPPPTVLPIHTESGVQDVPFLLPFPSPPISAIPHLRKRMAHVPIPYITRHPVCTQTRKGAHKALPAPSVRAAHSHRRGAHKSTHPPSPSLPGPFLPIHTKWAPEGAREGTPPPAPPFPSARKGGARGHAAPGTSLPPWLHHPIRAGRGTRDPTTTGPSPSPFDCAALYTRDRGARGQATSSPTLPIRVEEARTRDM
ncbi:hypothetical protein EDB86DRAFT_3070867 [Lactarius hatsudake]|nr:hypothetical protein EDB86DRAFT_3070867 [Lactarius hatsudake]